MSHQYYSEKNVNIDIFPGLDNDHRATHGTQLTIGDLHGNALKLLYVLVRHGIAQITEIDYKKFVEIYRKPVDELTQSDIDAFKQIIKNIVINDNLKSFKLCLIGDMLCDRGMNDYYTLLLLQKLNQFNVEYEIMISNHDAEFIKAYEKNTTYYRYSFPKEQGKSAANLQYLTDKGLVNDDEVNKVIVDCYKPSLKLLSYSLDQLNNTITIFSHAAIGVDNIRVIARKLWDDITITSCPRRLAEIIDNINATFKKNYVDQNKISELFNREQVSNDAFNGKINIDFNLCPFNHLIWNRYVDNLERPNNMYFVHGHDVKDRTHLNIFNLDNHLGKALSYHDKGEYNVLYTTTESLELALQQDNAEINNDIGSPSLNRPLISPVSGNASSDSSNKNLFERKTTSHLVKNDQSADIEKIAFNDSPDNPEQIIKPMKYLFINVCKLNKIDKKADCKRIKQDIQPEIEILSLDSMELYIQPLLFKSSNAINDIHFSSENTRSIQEMTKLKRKIQEIN